MRTHRALLCLLVGATAPAIAVAATCAVPGAHATVQQAVDDPTCTTIQLAAQTFVQSVLVERTLTLAGDAGGGSALQGELSAAGAGVVVTVDDLAVSNGCVETLAARSGAQILGTRVTALHASALGCGGPAGGGATGKLFSDGFESGGTRSWSFRSP